MAAAAALSGPPGATAAPSAPAPARAGEEAPAVPPRFAIETIRVEGVRPRSEAVVVAASLLEPGRSYGERELRDAVSRIVRLPFVLAADFALERGSERGAYALVVRAVETRRFVFAADHNRTYFDREVLLSNAPGSRHTIAVRATAGYRQPLGLYGEAFVALESERGAHVGFAHYNLLGRRATGSVAYARSALCCTSAVFPLALDPGFGDWSLSGTEQAAARLALPLGGNHGLRFTAEMLRSDDVGRNGVLTLSVLDDFADVPAFEHRRADLAWVYDDSDDPLAPRSGRTWAVGIEIQDLDGRSARYDQAGVLLESVALRSEMMRAVASGVVHHPLSARQSVSVAARLAAGRGRVEGVPAGAERLRAGDLDGAEASLAITHRLTLWQPPEKFATLWLETEAGYAYEEVSPALSGALSSLGQGRIGVWLVFRNTWGVFRGGVAFVDLEESRR